MSPWTSFWIGYILGALVAFDQSNTMMGWFILIAGGFATFVFYLSKRWFLSNHNPTCRFGLKWSNLLFLLTTIIGGIILAISLWLKNQLIDTISATNSNIPYLAILIVCLGILLALVYACVAYSQSGKSSRNHSFFTRQLIMARVGD